MALRCYKLLICTQIFEWCQFMMSCGKCADSNVECQKQSLPTVTEFDKLSDAEFPLLKEAYKQLLPRYSELCLQYEADCMKSKQANSLDIKCFSEWVPLGGLQTGDQVLLQEPDNKVKFEERFTIQDEMTKRFITCTSGNLQKSSSYIRFFSNDSTATFGKIKSCFTHCFAGEATEFILLNVYDSPQHDSDTNLW